MRFSSSPVYCTHSEGGLNNGAASSSSSSLPHNKSECIKTQALSYTGNTPPLDNFCATCSPLRQAHRQMIWLMDRVFKKRAEGAESCRASTGVEEEKISRWARGEKVILKQQRDLSWALPSTSWWTAAVMFKTRCEVDDHRDLEGRERADWWGICSGKREIWKAPAKLWSTSDPVLVACVRGGGATVGKS